MVTFQQLRQVDCTAWRDCGDAARKLARELQQHGAEAEERRTSLSASWDGADATAAANTLATVSGGYREAAASYGRVDATVSNLATRIGNAQSMLESAVASAPSIPGRVDENGAVHVNYEALGPNPSPAAVAQAQQNASQVSGWIHEIVAEATQADQQASTELAGLTPAAGAGESEAAQDGVPARHSDPQQVNQWWNGLSQSEQERLLAEHPKRVGELDGVPVQSRDIANRTAMDQEMRHVQAERAELEERIGQMNHSPAPGNAGTPEDREWHEAMGQRRDLDTRIENLESIDAQLARAEQQSMPEDLYLINYDSHHDGELVASIGNPDTADHVITQVPGMGTDVEGIDSNVTRALQMKMDAADVAPDGASTASVMWLGYDAPDGVFSAATSGYYRDAEADLTSFQHGLRATHEGPEPSVNTLVGHSYGSSTVGNAAASNDLQVDNLVFVASPGVTVGSAADFQGIDPENVWATRGGDDPVNFVSWLPFHGSDPTSDGFGAQVFPTDGGGHGGYWAEGNQARDHMANIFTGQYDQVHVVVPETPEPALTPQGP